jgi:hypothetical protein
MKSTWFTRLAVLAIALSVGPRAARASQPASAEVPKLAATEDSSVTSSPQDAPRAAAPHVLEIAPDMGDADVDPALSQLRIVFDRDMSSRGHSICGGGPYFPVFGGEFRWENPRTFVMDMKLEPGHDYSFSVNCTTGRNFRSAEGTPAEPYPVMFRTLTVGAAAVLVSPDQSQAALKELRRLITEEYSYRDRLGIDWQAVFDAAAPQVQAARSRGALGRALARTLAPAQDPHLTIDVVGLWVRTFTPSVVPNFNAKLLQRSLPALEKKNRIVTAARYEEGIVYLNIASWGLTAENDELQPALDVIAACTDAKGLILDVRANGGGAEPVAKRIAGCFVPEEYTYSRHRNVAPGVPGGLGPMCDRSVQPLPDGPAYRGRVALLIGPACMSSNESFILMMRGDPQCRSFGARTRGSSGNPHPHELAAGLRVNVPSWQDYFPDGTLLEGRGIDPDQPVEFAPAPAGGDPVLAAALEWLRQ